MSVYNKKKTGQPAIASHQGGVAFQQSPEIALISLLATGLTKAYYEGSDDREQRLVSLMQQVAAKDKYFLAQMIVYARTKMGQRTITHRAAAEMAKYAAGEKWAKRFFSKYDRKNQRGGIVFRMDDMLEIAAAYYHVNPKASTITNAMKSGFKQAIEAADPFELARYQGQGKSTKLIDIVNLVRPVPQKWNAEALNELVKTGKLKVTGTSESENSAAGQEVAKLVKSGEITKEQAEEVLEEKIAGNFSDLLNSGKMGYMQLLRNLRNIVNADAGLIDVAGKLLTNEAKIKASLVFPHQIDLAVEVLIHEFGGKLGQKLLAYLSDAYELSVSNVFELGIDEFTAVVIDTSGSMFGSYSPLKIDGRSVNRMPIEKAALIGATLAKGVHADVYQFATTAAELKYNARDSVNTIKNGFMAHQGEVGHSTYLDEFWRLALAKNKHYNRVFIVSDLQLADGMVQAGSAYKAYASKFGQPYIYAIDLVGYGNQPMKQSNDKYFNLVGYSAQIYETAKKYELNPKALIEEIKQVVI